MDRRNALKGLATVAGGLLVPKGVFAGVSDLFKPGMNFGWHRDDASLRNFIERHRYPFVRQQNHEIRGSGQGKKAFLHLPLERVMGSAFAPHDQKAPDCVSQGFALGTDMVSAVQIVTQRKPEKWVAKAATEPIYGGSRVEIGGYTGPGGGSTGHWGAEWISRYGILLRQRYPGGFDFTTYDHRLAEEYGREGCPDALEPVAKLHPVKKTAICTSYREMCDCIYNGCPVVVCSSVGFGNGGICTRDSEGFLTRKRRPWYHCMLFGGYDDEYRRPGGLCFNSWGIDWINGPTRGPQPLGTFWVDASTVDRMLSEGDSFALSGYVGYPRLVIPPYVLR